MTDQELLELSAKAGGVVLDYTGSSDGKPLYCSRRNALARANGSWFAPLTDDGDALRLLMSIRGELHTVDSLEGSALSQVYVLRQHRIYLEHLEHHGGDACAAARRAIVRAAADLGKDSA
jgi:hypothetical protein